jgi:Spy/CpxP family protein refolding chaperone
MLRIDVSRHARIAAVTLTAFLLPAAALAQLQPGPHRAGDRHREMAGRIMDQLELTAEQRAAVENLHRDLESGMEATREQLRDARSALFESIHAAQFDESAVRQAAAGVASLEADLAVARARGFQQFRALLTPEQQQELDSIHEHLQMLRPDDGGPHGFGAHETEDF